MIRRITFAALSAAVVLGGAIAPAAGTNIILGGYLGAPAADQKSEAGNVNAAAPAGRHARKVKAAVATSRHARDANASAPASQYPGNPGTANASAAPAAQKAIDEDIDPRAAYLQKRKGSGSHQTSCDTNPQCNGWAEWLTDVESGKRPMVGAHAQ